MQQNRWAELHAEAARSHGTPFAYLSACVQCSTRIMSDGARTASNGNFATQMGDVINRFHFNIAFNAHTIVENASIVIQRN